MVREVCALRRRVAFANPLLNFDDFRYDMVTHQPDQLSDGPADDFDPCLPPSGRIVFTSTRRCGVGRCLLTPPPLTYTLHSMRPAAYVHPGESMSCMGCHEDKWNPESKYTAPMAMRRAPSKLVQEVASGTMPFNFIQLVKKPVFDWKCVACHVQHPGAPDMSHTSLARNDLAFSYAGEKPLNTLGLGGSRTAPVVDASPAAASK